jgi:hypothetical protein
MIHATIIDVVPNARGATTAIDTMILAQRHSYWLVGSAWAVRDAIARALLDLCAAQFDATVTMRANLGRPFTVCLFYTLDDARTHFAGLRKDTAHDTGCED